MLQIIDPNTGRNVLSGEEVPGDLTSITTNPSTATATAGLTNVESHRVSLVFTATGFHSPGKLLEFYVRPGIFGIISRFTLVITL